MQTEKKKKRLHILIPNLPKQLVDATGSPTPFIIGIDQEIFEKVKQKSNFNAHEVK